MPRRFWVVLLAFAPGLSRGEEPHPLSLWPPSHFDVVKGGRGSVDGRLAAFDDAASGMSLALTVALPSFEPGWSSQINFDAPEGVPRSAVCVWLPAFPGSDEAPMPAPNHHQDVEKFVQKAEAPIEPGIVDRLESAWRRAIRAARVPDRMTGGCDGEGLVFAQFDDPTLFTAVVRSWSPEPGTVAAQMREVGLKLCEYARSCDRDRGARLEALHLETTRLEALLDALP